MNENNFGLELDDDDAEATVMRSVVNVTDEVVKFSIASMPGSKPLRYKLAPYGKPGCTVSLQEGYTMPYKGAGREMVDPIIERITKRHVAGNEGDRLPMVVDQSKADASRAAWLRAHAAHRASKARKPITVALEVDPETLQPRAARVAAETVKPAAPPMLGEVVAQDTIEPPHPDDDPILADGPPGSGPEPEPEPVIAPPTSRRARG
jgi:hypothetical protein